MDSDYLSNYIKRKLHEIYFQYHQFTFGLYDLENLKTTCLENLRKIVKNEVSIRIVMPCLEYWRRWGN